jgi:hypothetical protein
MTLRRGATRTKPKQGAHVPWLALAFALVAVFLAVRTAATLLVLR